MSLLKSIVNVLIKVSFGKRGTNVSKVSVVFSEERSSSEFPSCFVDFGVTIFALVEILVSCDLNFYVNINVTAKEIATIINKTLINFVFISQTIH